jgi:purine-binding chemotaxis protein CheW
VGKKLKKISPTTEIDKRISEIAGFIQPSTLENVEANLPIDGRTNSGPILKTPEVAVELEVQTGSDLSQEIKVDAKAEKTVDDKNISKKTKFLDDVRNSESLKQELKDKNNRNSKNKDDAIDGSTADLSVSISPDYSELFTYERQGMQFALPVQNVQEVIRDFGVLSELPIGLRGCAGSIIYKGKLIPVFECADFARAGPDRKIESFQNGLSLVRVIIEGIEVCFTMDCHIEVVSTQTGENFPSLQSVDHVKNPGYIRNTIGYNTSNLFLINLEKIWSDLRANLGDQAVIDTKSGRTKVDAIKAEINFSDYICARIHDYHFVVDVESVLEVIEGHDVTQIHDSSNFVRGLINLRGQVIACIDISTELRRDKLIIDERNKYLVLRYAKHEFALCVDEVVGIRTFEPSSFVSSSSILSGDVSGLFSAVAEQGPDTLLQLSTESIINSSRLNVYKKAASE